MYFIEAGLVLVVTPWSDFWDRNYFIDVLPFVGVVANSAVARGAVTGVGVVTAMAGVLELAGLRAWRRAGRVNSAGPA